jgi:phosphonate transport system permease protein
MPELAASQAHWQRLSAAQRLARTLLWLAVGLAVAASLRTIELIPEFLADAPAQMLDLFRRMWPVAWNQYPKGVHTALVETVHIATLGTLLALLLALPFALLVARNICSNRLLNALARLVLVSSRSVNSLVWALLFVAVFGPGALAGTLAIALRSVGFIGKLLGEAIEASPPGPIEAISAAGAGRLGQLLYAVWPQVEPAFWSVALLRWDINLRESAVLGLVGAGGIGMAMNAAIDLFQWDRVALILISILGLVLATEVAVTLIRARLIRTQQH